MKLNLVNVIRVFALSIEEEKENFLFKTTQLKYMKFWEFYGSMIV